MAVVSRREYALKDSYETAKACADAYASLTNDVGGNPKKEALRWARSINCYRNDVRIQMENARLVERNAYEKDPFYMHFFNLWTQRIIGPVLGSVLDEPNFR